MLFLISAAYGVPANAATIDRLPPMSGPVATPCVKVWMPKCGSCAARSAFSSDIGIV